MFVTFDSELFRQNIRQSSKVQNRNNSQHRNNIHTDPSQQNLSLGEKLSGTKASCPVIGICLALKLNEAAERNEVNRIQRFANPLRPQARWEADSKLLHVHAGTPGGNQMAQLMQ